MQSRINPAFDYVDHEEVKRIDKSQITNSKLAAETCIKVFKQFIENNGGRDLISGSYSNKVEKMGQGIFFGISKAFLLGLNFDISREDNSGRGQCDFKISCGSDCTVVEMKRSSSKDLLHGYEVQIDEYAEACETNSRIYLVLNEGKNEALENLKTKNLADKGNKLNVPDLEVVDVFHLDPASTFNPTIE